MEDKDRGGVATSEVNSKTVKRPAEVRWRHPGLAFTTSVQNGKTHTTAKQQNSCLQRNIGILIVSNVCYTANRNSHAKKMNGEIA